MRLSLFLTTLQPEVGLLFFLFYFTHFDFSVHRCARACSILQTVIQSRAVFVHETFFFACSKYSFLHSFSVKNVIVYSFYVTSTVNFFFFLAFQ